MENKNDPLYSFIPQQSCTSRQTKSSQEIAEILADTELSKKEKRDRVYKVLTNN